MAQTKVNETTIPSRKQLMAWNGTAADYNILTNSPGYDATTGAAGTACRAIIVASPAGSLVYTGVDGVDVAVPQAILLASPVLPINAIALKATGSGNAYVMVLW